MRRILVVTPWKRRWEMGNSAGVADDRYFIEALTRRGWEVHYVSPRDTAPPDVSLANYYVHAFPNVLAATERWPTLVRRPLWPLLFTVFAVRRARQVARRYPPAVVLGQTPLSAPAVRMLALRLRVPSVVKLFGVVDLDRTDWPRWKYVYKNLEQILAFKVKQDAWIVLDDGTGGREAALRHGVPPDALHEFPNGINTEWADRARDPAARARYGLSPEHAVVLYVSRLTQWKRPDLFLCTVPRVLAEARRPVTVLVAGDGPMRARCEALARELGIADSVRFLGPVPHGEIADLMSVADVFASTNLRSNRGIPTCEALVCGVPVVAFDLGDTGRVVRDGETGRLIAEGDVEGFADAVVALLNDDSARREMGARAREFARAEFTGWPERTDREAGLIERLAERGIA